MRVRGCLRIRPGRMGRDSWSESLSFRVSVVVVVRRWEMCGRREVDGGGTRGLGSGAVMRKSVSVPLTCCALLVSYHTPRPLVVRVSSSVLVSPRARDMRNGSWWSIH